MKRRQKYKDEKEEVGPLNTRALQYHPLARITPDQLESMEIRKTSIFVNALC